MVISTVMMAALLFAAAILMMQNEHVRLKMGASKSFSSKLLSRNPICKFDL
jgi:hypothetical protein